jgi:putative spermidine/putrescine transport system substrate-binding protein
MSEAVAALRAQKQAGLPEDGSVDLLWIQGDQFRSAKNEGVLFGPLTDGLPNRKLVDWSKPSVSRDFGEPVDSLASPWGMRQMVMVHDEKRTPQPPSTMADLLDWIREHPGRFAYPAPPDAAGSAFVRQVFYHVGGGAAPWQGPFDASRFETAAADCYKLLREIAPFLWHEGRTYPESATRLDTLFADREVDFSVNLQPAAASRNIAAGRYPDSVRTLVFKEGTIGGAHFVAIPFNAAHKAGAMVVANFLLSPEAQLEMADPQVWGELAVIDPSRLDTTWREKFRRLQRGIATLPDSVLESHRLPEPASEIALRLESEWQAQVPGQR